VDRNHTNIQTLFLIRDTLEYQRAIDLIGLKHKTKYDILTIKDEHPYLVNECARFDRVSEWQKYGIVDSGFSRYWLDEYKTIEGAITAEMAKDNKYNNKILQSQHFKFSLVWSLGLNVYDTINSLNSFFSDIRPAIIYFTPKNTFISRVLLSFGIIYKIEYRKLS
jgi:hypothetical protein